MTISHHSNTEHDRNDDETDEASHSGTNPCMVTSGFCDRETFGGGSKFETQGPNFDLHCCYFMIAFFLNVDGYHDSNFFPYETSEIYNQNIVIWIPAGGLFLGVFELWQTTPPMMGAYFACGFTLPFIS